MRSPLLLAAAWLAFAIPAAADVRVREVHIQPLASTNAEVASPEPSVRANATFDTDALPSAVMALYPSAGTIDRDVVIPYFVDLDDSPARRDWNCSDLTFNGHAGHDAYIRSFAEKRIGVPVFTPRDGVVIDLHDGETDENTTNDPALRANYVTIRHDADEITQYVHLRKGIPVTVGEFVTEGTQIGWVGSSGMSVGPHTHFEARVADVFYEPMAGPCRPGRSYFSDQPVVADEPVVFGITFSDRSFDQFPAPPYDDAPHVATFLRGTRTMFFKVEVANVGPSTTYELLLEKPGSTYLFPGASGVLKSIDVSLASIWWGLEVDLDREGTWAMVVRVDGQREFALPFRVVSRYAEIANRPPNEIAAELEPVTLRANQAAVCRVRNGTFADPDYDVVRYRYEWRVDGVLVRDVTTAAQSDALARQFVTRGVDVSCSITASDGTLSAPTASVHGTPVSTPRRRAVRD